jgi:hypothetical protein
MYYFPPMMPFWGRFLGAPTKWLMSNEGRLMIANAIKLCRKKHGHAEARRFHLGLVSVGCIYPLLPEDRPINQ